MDVRRYAEAAAFVADVEALLVADEPLHTYFWAVLARLRREPDLDSYLAAARDDRGRVLGAAAATSAARVALSRARHEAAVPALLEDALAHFGAIEQLMAPSREAALAATAHRGHGGSVATTMRQRAFACDRVRPPGGVPGRLRPTGPADRSLLELWVAAFLREALDEDDPDRARHVVEVGIGGDEDDHALLVWEDSVPVCMAGCLGPTPNGITILSVYTSPEHRGRGYASACVAALTQRLLERGRRRVFLSTDLSNPTSNAIYQRIGYAPAGDLEVLTLS
jgi:uncharacterized protein